FVDMDIYDAGKGRVDLDSLRDAPCWLGVDLSSIIDLSVIVACWRDADGYVVHPWFFCPENNIEEREYKSRGSYQHWVDEGFIEATGEDTIDYTAITNRIVDICEDFNVQEIAFDPFMAKQ